MLSEFKWFANVDNKWINKGAKFYQEFIYIPFTPSEKFITKFYSFAFQGWFQDFFGGRGRQPRGGTYHSGQNFLKLHGNEENRIVDGVGDGGCWRVSAWTILPCRSPTAFCWHMNVHVCEIGCDFQGSFTLSCSMWTLNWILCESIWRRCHFRVQHYSLSGRQNRSRLCLVQFLWNGKNP